MKAGRKNTAINENFAEEEIFQPDEPYSNGVKDVLSSIGRSFFENLIKGK